MQCWEKKDTNHILNGMAGDKFRFSFQKDETVNNRINFSVLSMLFIDFAGERWPLWKLVIANGGVAIRKIRNLISVTVTVRVSFRTCQQLSGFWLESLSQTIEVVVLSSKFSLKKFNFELFCLPQLLNNCNTHVISTSSEKWAIEQIYIQ